LKLFVPGASNRRLRRAPDLATADVGVGDGSELVKRGTKSVHHLPGVGQNLLDHPDFGYVSDKSELQRPSFNDLARLLRGISECRRERRGPMTSNFAECGTF
jgi:choline dehydrogenase-like flavoprotein